MAIDKVLTGNAGKNFVAAELSRRGYIAALTQRNTAGVDILASSEDGSRSVAIQVKTTTGKSASWRLSSKSEKVKDKNLFYVFVRLNSVNETPDYYRFECRSCRVHSKVASKVAFRCNEEWCAT